MLAATKNTNKLLNFLAIGLGLLSVFVVVPQANAFEESDMMEFAQAPPPPPPGPGPGGGWHKGGHRPPPPRHHGNGGGQDFLRELFQQLGLSPAQKQKLLPILAQFRKEKMAEKAQNKPMGVQEKMQLVSQKLERIKKALWPHLNGKQQKKLEAGLAELSKKVKLKMMGPAGHLMEALKSLKLTPNQKVKLQALAEKAKENHKKDWEAMKAMPHEKRFHAMKGKMEAFHSQLEKILSPAQMEQLKKKMMEMRHHWKGQGGGRGMKHRGPGPGGPPPPEDEFDF